MPIRYVVLTLAFVGLLPVCVARPWIGVLVWCWLGFMNPHRLTWGFSAQLPFAFMAGIATLVGLVFTNERKPFIWNVATGSLLALWIWFTVTSLFALYPPDAWTQWNRVSKILLMVFASVFLVQDRRKLRLLLLVIAGSIGFYGLRGGIFALRTGGVTTLEGVPGSSFISSNNDFALALNMCLPLFLVLAREERRPWLRALLYATFFFSIVAVLFTYSRGGFLGLLAVLAVLFLNRKSFLYALAAASVVYIAAFYFAPPRWTARMETIETYEADRSAQMRLIAWRVGRMLAADRPLVGGGFAAFNQETFDRYAPDYPGGSYGDAHSIYFNLLGEHGYPGLLLFSVLVGFLLVRLAKLRRLAKKSADLAWVSSYAHMLQASIVAYLVTGAFLSVAYFDLAYQLFIIAVILDRLAAQEISTPAPPPEPALPPEPAPAALAARLVHVGARL